MRTHSLPILVALCSIALAMTLTSSRAQTANATWIGPSSGGEWNTAADWDIGVPAEGTNALVGVGTNVSYNVPMVATTFGILTNEGVLNINAAGFNCSGIVLPNPSGGDKVFINNGGNVTVNGNFFLSTNASTTMTAGSSLTVNGALVISYNTSTKAGGTATFTNSGGTLNAFSTAVNNNSGTENALMVISGGNNNLGNTVVSRSSAGSGGFNALGSEGLIIYNGVVTMTNLNVGDSQGASYLTTLIANGTVTNQGSVSINQGTGGSTPRASRLLQTGGLFVVPDPGVVNPNSTVASAISIYSVTGGTNIIGGLYLGNSNNTATATANITNNAVIYVGSQGIASNGTVTINVSLGNGGKFGATAPWVGSANMKLPGGMFTFQAADLNGNPNSITLSNALTGSGGFNKAGGGTLTLDAANTYAGNTMINAGTLAVGGTGSLLDSLDILVGSGTTFDVSQATSYTVNGSPSQTLSGFGTVNGAVNVASGGVVYPGSNTLTGTLIINGGLVETGGAVNEFQLSGSPSGPNDFLNASGGITVSGVNSIQINGNGLQSGGIYPLISYGSGGFNGSLANFNLVGATGVLSNSVTAQTIYLIVQVAVRAATNITWVGSVANNNWDTETTSNWMDTGSANKDYFVPGDNVLLGNLGLTNVINVPGSPTPGSITVNTTTNYTITGLGAIDGNGTLTVSNGTLTMLTTNIFNAPVILDGGVFSTPIIANSSTPSAIGESSASPGNLIFNGGTLAYTGSGASTDHGMTLTNGGGTIDVTNGSSLTLNGSIIGNGTLTVVDGGALILNNPNSYTNSTTIAGVVLQLNTANGAGSGTINFSNATLIYNPSAGVDVPNAFNFVAGTTNMIAVTSGSSGNPISEGAWTGGGVILISNTYNPYTVNGNLDGFKGTIVLDSPLAGKGFRFNSGGGNTSTGSTNATFDLSNTNALLVCRNPGVIDLGALQGDLGAEVMGPTATPGILIWSIGANNASTTYGGLIANGTTPANEASGLAKVGTGTLTLVGGVETFVVGIEEVTLETNLLEYTGPTTISNGVLAIVVPDALNLSSNVTLASSSAVLDASQMGFVDDNGNPVTNSVFEVISGQTLAGIGTIRGFLVTDPGSTFNVGLPGSTGIMTVTNAVTINGTIQLKLNRAGSPTSDELISQASITNSGSLVVTNIGGALQGGDTFTLFSATSFVGTFSSVTLPTLPAGQSWNTNNLYINGTISVVGSAGGPGFSSIKTSGNNIVLNATGGTPGGPVSVLTSTNLLLPLSQWSTLTSGNFDSNGDFTYTVTGALTSGLPQQFYILQIP